MIRVIEAVEITRTIRRLCIEANRQLPADMEACIRCAAEKENHPIGKSIMKDICDNMDAARELTLPVCQDTGMAVVFAEVGQDVHIDGNFEEAVNEGVRQGLCRGLAALLGCGRPHSPGQHQRQHTGSAPHPAGARR